MNDDDKHAIVRDPRLTSSKDKLFSLYAWVLSMVVLGAALLPVQENRSKYPVDSFPLSYYPMFSHAHPEIQTFTYVLATDDSARRHYVHYRHCGSGGLNQVRKQIAKIARYGEKDASELCRAVAGRLAQREPEFFSRLTRVSLVSGEFRPTEYFGAGRKEPISERVHGAFEIPHVTLEGFPKWLREHVQSLAWASHPNHQPILSRRTLEDSMRLGRRYLLNNQKAAGNFNYNYDFVERKMDGTDNQVRQAGALWGLSLLYQYEQDAQTGAALDLGLDFFLAHTCPGGADKALAIAYPDEFDCNSGTVALTCLAIIEYLRVGKAEHTTLSKERRQKLEETLDGYIRHLESMRLENKHFSDSWSLTRKRRGLNWNPYCDGETLLCFIKAAKYLGRSRLVPLIEDTALDFAKCYSADQWKTNTDSDLTKGFFQWSCMAFWEYHDTEWKNARVFDDYVLAMGGWMLHVHRTLERSRNTAYAYEGIIPAYVVAKERGHGPALNDLGWTIDQGLTKLTSWQVGGPLWERNAFLMAHQTQDPLAIGGVMNAQDKAPLRIDVTQHQMHAVIMALRHVYTESAETKEGR
jgi:UDP-N-acetylmuramoyl-tripeptide--D-alanyl-D-alanine ligase